ncbi:ribonuclease P/MRP protein subunit POP5 [Venturia canescens]|uniref:ribonuclease P/MRP protein subunit POP5 n=1 Tax=Venturia canescens TaxID=32260 RepID=UPI001C9CC37F|nr:ribonuclease P/MRP protein subunit POP5 [Venturia canescens]
MVRFKNRYITIEIVPQGNEDKPLVLKTTALHLAIQDKVQKLYGDFGQAAIKAGFNAKYCNTHTRIALIKVRHGPHKFVIDSLPFISDVGGRLVKVNIIYVGATMKHCFNYIKKHQRKKLEELWSSLRTDMERKQMQDALTTLTPAMKDFQ